MSNRSYDYEITWCWKEDGNRPENIEAVTTVRSTTVQRAISKLVRELNDEDGAGDGAEEVRASDLLVIDVRNHKITGQINAVKAEAS
jgi:hypothetical protein